MAKEERELFPLALRMLGERGLRRRTRFSGRKAEARDRKLHDRFVGRDALEARTGSPRPQRRSDPGTAVRGTVPRAEPDTTPPPGGPSWAEATASTPAAPA
jgi:hypothetical protein